MGTEKERKDTQKALLYDLRLIFSTGEKEDYTKQEILELLDKIALAKDQEERAEGPGGSFPPGPSRFSSFHPGQKASRPAETGAPPREPLRPSGSSWDGRWSRSPRWPE